jgi:DnaJ-class molecular chaperone
MNYSQNHYKKLGVNKNSSFDDIQTAYNTKIQKYKFKPNLNEMDKIEIKAINSAHYILSDYHNRRNFDVHLDKRKKKLKQKIIVEDLESPLDSDKKSNFNYENNGIDYTSMLLRPFSDVVGLPRIDTDLENSFRMSGINFKKSLKKSNDQFNVTNTSNKVHFSKIEDEKDNTIQDLQFLDRQFAPVVSKDENVLY